MGASGLLSQALLGQCAWGGCPDDIWHSCYREEAVLDWGQQEHPWERSKEHLPSAPINSLSISSLDFPTSGGTKDGNGIQPRMRCSPS